MLDTMKWEGNNEASLPVQDGSQLDASRKYYVTKVSLAGPVVVDLVLLTESIKTCLESSTPIGGNARGFVTGALYF